jgi:N-acetylglucosaminyldiphosphoundecaprenol N-acetyl-beta-D-mannosaminyltransferase
MERPIVKSASVLRTTKLHALASTELLGIAIHDVTMQETLSLLREMVEEGIPSHVMTVNPEFLMTARHHQEFRTVLLNADLKVPDGIGIILGAALMGSPMRERVAGVDVVRFFATVARDNGYRIFFLGAAAGVAERTAAILQKENPGLQVAGTYAGSPRPEEEEKICAMIEATHPHILFVAYGHPKQDLWIARTKERLNIPVALGVGGSFDFIAGVVPRAPFWMRRSGLEWCYRLWKEPWRWRRMLALPAFAFLLLWSRVSKQRRVVVHG